MVHEVAYLKSLLGDDLILADQVVFAGNDLPFEKVVVVALLVHLGLVLVAENLVVFELGAENVLELVEMRSGDNLRGSLMLESSVVYLGVVNGVRGREEAHRGAEV